MIKVLLFAGLAEAAGASEILLERNAMTTSEIREELAGRYPEMKDRLWTSMIAVNQEYVNGETEVKSGDEVAFIPPVSGG